MANYLRDLTIKNRAFTGPAVDALYNAFAEAGERLRESLKAPGQTKEPYVFFSVVIRFDNQGYRVWSLAELQKYFKQANDIERLSFEIDTELSINSNRSVGGHCMLQLDSRDPNRCLLQVAADDKAWVEQTFAEVSFLIDKRKTVSRFIRTPVTQWLIQVCGVFLGVLGCIWVARQAAPALSIESPFLISFLVALLIFSNTWTFLLQIIHAAIARAFPNVMLLRADEERLHWGLQAVVAVVIAAALSGVGKALWDLVAFAANDILRT